MIVECLAALAAAGRDDAPADDDPGRAALLDLLADDLDLVLVAPDGRLTTQAAALLPAADRVLAVLHEFFAAADGVASHERHGRIVRLAARPPRTSATTRRAARRPA